MPASLHLTLAAAAVRQARVSADDVVVDPFCGTGTLLAERALLGPYKQLVGYDIDSRALSVAGENLAAFKGVVLKRRSIVDRLDLTRIDEIITNPPYGVRVGTRESAKELHSRLDKWAVHSLRRGGVLVTFRPLDFPAPAGLQLVSNYKVDAGGLTVRLISARKP